METDFEKKMVSLYEQAKGIGRMELINELQDFIKEIIDKDGKIEAVSMQLMLQIKAELLISKHTTT